jgi:hypothetical protein
MRRAVGREDDDDPRGAAAHHEAGAGMKDVRATAAAHLAAVAGVEF